jgi:hypothetical protein
MIEKINSNNKFMFVINNPKGTQLYRLGEIRTHNVIGDRN